MTLYKPLLLFLLLSCCKEKMQVEHPTKLKKPATVIANKKSIIILQPFADFPKHYLRTLIKTIEPITGSVILINHVNLPQTAYYKPRNRYRADNLISWLNDRTDPKHVTIGLTTNDISTSKGDVADWGIMGLAYRPGKACVVSSFRLKNKKDELFKVAIHELAHTQGLPHCPIKNCYMRDAEGGNQTKEETGFCSDCKSYLINKGWTL